MHMDNHIPGFQPENAGTGYKNREKKALNFPEIRGNYNLKMVINAFKKLN